MDTLTLIVDDIALSAFAGLMVWAALCDIRSFTIPNRIAFAVLAIYPAYVLSSVTAVDWAGAIVVGLVVLAIGFAFYLLNWTGAGDVKLLTAASVWAGQDLIAPFILVTCVAGGALSVGMMLRVRFARTGASEDGTSPAIPFVALLKINVPYGAAIAVGGLYIVLRRLAV